MKCHCHAKEEYIANGQCIRFIENNKWLIKVPTNLYLVCVNVGEPVGSRAVKPVFDYVLVFLLFHPSFFSPQFLLHHSSEMLSFTFRRNSPDFKTKGGYRGMVLIGSSSWLVSAKNLISSWTNCANIIIYAMRTHSNILTFSNSYPSSDHDEAVCIRRLHSIGN